MRKSLLFVAALAASAPVFAGPLDFYSPRHSTPKAPDENSRKWLAASRTEFNGILTTRNFTYNPFGCPTGYKELIVSNATLQSQSETETYFWDSEGRCVREEFEGGKFEYAYDVYGRMTGYKETVYTGSGEDTEVNRVTTSEYGYDDTGYLTLESTLRESFRPKYSANGTKRVEMAEKTPDGAVVETTLNYRWNAETADWANYTKTEQTTVADDAGRTITTYTYQWDAASAGWIYARKSVARYRSDLIPGVRVSLLVESATYALDASGNELNMTASMAGTMTPGHGEYEYSFYQARYDSDSEGNRVEVFSDTSTETYETYTADNGSIRTFVKFVSSVQRNRDNSSGEMVVTYKSVQNACRYGTLNRETISSPIGSAPSRRRYEFVYDDLGRCVASNNYSALGEEDYCEEQRVLTEYLDDTSTISARKMWRYSSYEGALVLQEDVACEYDTSVAADEVVAHPGQLPDMGDFMLVKLTASYGGGPVEVSDFTYFDRSAMVGVENVAADSDAADSSLTAEIFTLGGVKVGEFASPRDAGLPSGLYIERRGSSARKIRL